MVVRILGDSNVDVKKLLSSALKLYRKAPMPPRGSNKHIPEAGLPIVQNKALDNS
ncbi:MAG: hypothetical protein QXW41_03560 [Fervidicoccaceae archaeon]